MYQRQSVSESLRHYAIHKHDVVEFADSIRDRVSRVSESLRHWAHPIHPVLHMYIFTPTQQHVIFVFCASIGGGNYVFVLI